MPQPEASPPTEPGEPEPELRYADCPGTEVEVFIEARPADVWRLVSDIGLPARFSSEFDGAAWMDGCDKPAVGARFLGRNHHPAAGQWETTCTVVDYEEPRVFGYVVDGPDGPSATWRFTVRPESSGTLLKQSMQMGPGRSFLNLAIDAMPEKEHRIIRRRLREHRANMEANLLGMKATLEGSGLGEQPS